MLVYHGTVNIRCVLIQCCKSDMHTSRYMCAYSMAAWCNILQYMQSLFNVGDYHTSIYVCLFNVGVSYLKYQCVFIQMLGNILQYDTDAYSMFTSVPLHTIQYV